MSHRLPLALEKHVPEASTVLRQQSLLFPPWCFNNCIIFSWKLYNKCLFSASHETFPRSSSVGSWRAPKMGASSLCLLPSALCVQPCSEHFQDDWHLSLWHLCLWAPIPKSSTLYSFPSLDYGAWLLKTKQKCWLGTLWTTFPKHCIWALDPTQLTFQVFFIF